MSTAPTDAHDKDASNYKAVRYATRIPDPNNSTLIEFIILQLFVSQYVHVHESHIYIPPRQGWLRELDELEDEGWL